MNPIMMKINLESRRFAYHTVENGPILLTKANLKKRDQRLALLRDEVLPFIVKRVKEKHRFDMSGWGGAGFDKRHSCRTTGCLAGYATQHPSMRRHGLKARHDIDSHTSSFEPVFLTKDGYYLRGFPAVREFFLIGREQSSEIFGAHHQATVKSRKAAIERVLREEVAR